MFCYSLVWIKENMVVQGLVESNFGRFRLIVLIGSSHACRFLKISDHTVPDRCALVHH